MLAASLQNDEMFAKDKRSMANLVKARLGQLIYGDEAYYCTESLEDSEVSKAIITVKDAKKLVRLE
jgi:hypothetical protein